MEALLSLETLRDDDDRALGTEALEQRGQEGLGGTAHAVSSQLSPLLQAPYQGLHSGSSRNGLEQVSGQLQAWLFAKLKQSDTTVARSSSCGSQTIRNPRRAPSPNRPDLEGNRRAGPARRGTDHPENGGQRFVAAQISGH
jgi:hypothetical protein